jgi:MFS family permease
MLPEYSASQLGWIATIAVFLIFGVGIPIGALVDRYGTRPVVAPFVALGIISLGLLSLCKTYWQIVLCQGVAFGLACSGTTLPAVICVTQWFSTKRGLAVGLASAGSSFGGLIFPIMVSRLIDSHGFKTAIHWSTLVVGVCMITGLICCEGPYPPKRMAALKEKEPSTTLSLESPKSDEKPEVDDLGVSRSVEGPTTPAADQTAGKDPGMRHNLGPWIAFCVGVFCCTFSLLVPFDYLPSIAVEQGMKQDLAQYTLAMINAGSMVGRILPGFLSDHVGQFNVMALVSTLSAIALLAIWLPVYYFPTDGGVIFFSLFYGFVSGGYTSLLSPCVVALVDGQVANLGLKFGIACLCLAFG